MVRNSRSTERNSPTTVECIPTKVARTHPEKPRIQAMAYAEIGLLSMHSNSPKRFQTFHGEQGEQGKPA
jgi:hypothetical protein